MSGKLAIAEGQTPIAIISLVAGAIMLALGDDAVKPLAIVAGVLTVILAALMLAAKSIPVKQGVFSIILGAIVILIGVFAVNKLENDGNGLMGLILIFSALPMFCSESSNFGKGRIRSGNDTLDKVLAAAMLIIGLFLFVSSHTSVTTEYTDVLVRVGGAAMAVFGVLGILKAFKK